MSEIKDREVDGILSEEKRTFYTVFGKRAFDIVASSAAIIVLSPVLIISAVLVLIFHGNPILYHTIRAGKNGKPFRLYKFRSMTNETDEEGNLLPNKDRLTKLGRFIRKTSIDELPGLFNILKGDMSIIGPRPLPVEYNERYSPEQRIRLNIRPGLTCVSMNKEYEFPTWEEQFENDIRYIQNVSFLMDCRMILRTLKTAVNRKNRSVRENGTRAEFMGSKEQVPQL